MFGIITTSPSSPVPRRHADLDRITIFPREETTGPDDLELPADGTPRARRAGGDPVPDLRIFKPKSRRPRKADIERARRLLAADLTHIAHPSFVDPAARDALLAPATGFEGPGRDPTPADDGADGGPSAGRSHPDSRARGARVPQAELPEVPRRPHPRRHRSGCAGPDRSGRGRTVADRGPEAEEPDRRDPPATGRRARQEVLSARLRPLRPHQRCGARPDAGRESVRLCPGQPLQHLCHLGNPQRAGALRPQAAAAPRPDRRALRGLPRDPGGRGRAV